MKPLKQEDAPGISGGLDVEQPVVLIVSDDPLPAPYPGTPCYPTAPITPVIEEPFTLIKL